MRDEVEREGRESNDLEETKVGLSIPCMPEFIGVARLVILGVASRTTLSYDDIEDFRLAVGEACTSAIERAKRAGVTTSEIRIDCMAGADRLVIRVSDDLPILADPDPLPEKLLGGMEGEEGEPALGTLLMEILVDEIHTATDPDRGTTITMTKNFGRV